ncbi:MAG: formyltransferase family protein, partial [Bacillota bacterium]
MKIIIVTQADPFYLPIFFNKFLKLSQQQNKYDINGIVIQEPLGESSLVTLIKDIYNFYGPLDFSKQALRYLAKKSNCLLYHLGLKQKCLSIKALANVYKLPILPYTNVNSSEFINLLIKEEIDLVVSVSATQIFNSEVLTTPRYGCINIHSAPLPRYRGMMPNFWQMYHDEEYSVLTIHQMSDELDRGEIIHQYHTQIEDEMSLDDLVIQTKLNAATALQEVLLQF